MSCGICGDPLLVPADIDEGGADVPDDVALRCGHRYHWECLLDAGSARCSACGADGRGADGRFLVDVRNEGGLTHGFDMGAELVSTPVHVRAI
jgi:hypothetical protein